MYVSYGEVLNLWTVGCAVYLNCTKGKNIKSKMQKNMVWSFLHLIQWWSYKKKWTFKPFRKSLRLSWVLKYPMLFLINVPKSYWFIIVRTSFYWKTSIYWKLTAIEQLCFDGLQNNRVPKFPLFFWRNINSNSNNKSWIW